MRQPYRFNEISDPKDQNWGLNATETLGYFVKSKKVPYNTFHQTRSIEEQIEVLTQAVGGLAEILISKGRMSPQEFIEAIDAKGIFEVRANR